MPDIKPATPDQAGAWITEDQSDEHNGARVVLIARDHGWDGRDADEPGTDIIALAERDMAGDPDLTLDDRDVMAFRYAEWADQWLDRHVAPAGYNFGWCNGVYYLQSVTWWETETANGGPDRAFL